MYLVIWSESPRSVPLLLWRITIVNRCLGFRCHLPTVSSSSYLLGFRQKSELAISFSLLLAVDFKNIKTLAVFFGENDIDVTPICFFMAERDDRHCFRRQWHGGRQCFSVRITGGWQCQHPMVVFSVLKSGGRCQDVEREIKREGVYLFFLIFYNKKKLRK